MQRHVSDRKTRDSYSLAKIHRIPYLYRSFSAKVTYLVALLWKIICNLGDSMSLGHPVGCRVKRGRHWECVPLLAVRKASWNIEGVEPVNHEGPGC